MKDLAGTLERDTGLNFTKAGGSSMKAVSRLEPMDRDILEALGLS